MGSFRHKVFAVMVFMMVFSIGGGCDPQRKPIPPGSGPVPPDRIPRMLVKPAPPGIPAQNRDIADDITKRVESEPGVAKAYTVVMGNTVLVGFDVENTNQEVRITEVKSRVTEKAEADPRIVRAYVSADPGITARIREIAYNIERGKPVTDYLDEIGEIIRRIVPATT